MNKSIIPGRIDKKGNPQTVITEVDFFNKATRLVYNSLNKIENLDVDITIDNIVLANYGKILGGYKGLFAYPGSGKIVEVTFNGITKDFYVATYDKLFNDTINYEDMEEEFNEEH